MRRHLYSVLMLTSFATLSRLAAESGIRRLDGTRALAGEAKSLADSEFKRDKVMGAQIAILNRGHVICSAGDEPNRDGMAG